MFNITSGWWAWLGGSNQLNVNGSYGSLGAPAASNMPGARQLSPMVIDSENCAVYIFGGNGYDYSQSPGNFGIIAILTAC